MFFYSFMSTFQLNELPKEKRIKLIAEFYDAMNCMRNREETKQVLRDLLNPNEIAMLARRIQIAVLLEKGFQHREVAEVMDAGLNTVTRVKKSKQRHGEGYKLLFKRLRKLRKRQAKKRGKKRKVPADFGTFQWFKNVYPAYFSLFNLIDALAEDVPLQDDYITYKEQEAKNREE